MSKYLYNKIDSISFENLCKKLYDVGFVVEKCRIKYSTQVTIEIPDYYIISEIRINEHDTLPLFHGNKEECYNFIIGFIRAINFIPKLLKYKPDYNLDKEVTNNEYDKAKKEFETCKNCSHHRTEFERMNILEYQLGLELQIKDMLCDLDDTIIDADSFCSYWKGADFDSLYDGPMPEDKEMEIVNESTN